VHAQRVLAARPASSMGSGSSAKKKKYAADDETSLKGADEDARRAPEKEAMVYCTKWASEDAREEEEAKTQAKRHRRPLKSDEEETEHRHHKAEHQQKKHHHVAVQEDIDPPGPADIIESLFSKFGSPSDHMHVVEEADAEPARSESKRSHKSQSSGGAGNLKPEPCSQKSNKLEACQKNNSCAEAESPEQSTDIPGFMIMKPPHGRSAAKLDDELGLVTRKKGSKPLLAGGLSVVAGSGKRRSTEDSLEERDVKMANMADPVSPISPVRQARRAALHEHRVSALSDCESPAMADTLSPKTPGSAKSRGSSGKHSEGGRRGSALGAESLAMLHQLHDQSQDRDVDDGLCGFKVGDRVTTAGGPDAQGPWEKLGSGEVLEPGRKRGYITVSFEKTGDHYQLKAANLTNLSDPARSGSHVIKNDEVKLKKRERKIADYVLADDVFLVGDHVSFKMGGQGVVVKEGKTPDQVLVRFGDLGIRSVERAQLAKVKYDAERGGEAKKAEKVDDSNRQSYTLSLSDATGGFSEANVRSKDRKGSLTRGEEDGPADVIAAPVDLGPNLGFQVGDYVSVDDSGGNPIWKDIGVGCIRSEGQKPGTLDVQFDSGGDSWCMQASMLRHSVAPERKFRKQGQDIIPESDVGRQHRRAVHKDDPEFIARRGSKQRAGSKQKDL